MKKCRALEKQIKKELQHSKRTKIRQKAELGGKNLWKALRLVQNQPVDNLPEEIKLQDGLVVKTDSTKAEEFSKFFEKQDRF